MTKVMTIVGTRPELIKLSLVIQELDKSVDHILVHTGQNFDFELNEVFFKELGIRKPDYFLESAGKSAIETIANVLVKSDSVLEKENPDAVLIYGDTNSCLSAICAKKRKIPIFHMEAGNRCFDQRVPEEINRKIVDHLSDINMPLTEHGRDYLVREGIPQNMIIKTGSCMREILDHYENQISRSEVLKKLDLSPQKYFVVSAHREENVDKPETLKNLLAFLDQLVDRFGLKVIFSVHPRTRNQLEKHGLKSSNANILFSKPLGFFDYITLQKNAKCVISDSGTLTEESAILGFPAVLAREAHERPEGAEEGVLVMAPMKPDKLIEAIEYVVSFQKPLEGIAVKDYRAQSVSKTVVSSILSNIQFVNRTIWYKSCG